MKKVNWSSGVQGRQWLRVLVSVFSKEVAQEKGREDTLSSRFLPKSRRPLDLFHDSCVMSCARGVPEDVAKFIRSSNASRCYTAAARSF